MSINFKQVEKISKKFKIVEKCQKKNLKLVGWLVGWWVGWLVFEIQCSIDLILTGEGGVGVPSSRVQPITYRQISRTHYYIIVRFTSPKRVDSLDFIFELSSAERPVLCTRSVILVNLSECFHHMNHCS